MTRPPWHDTLHCPDCHSAMRADGYNRNGWWHAECGRRYSPSLRKWDSDLSATGCLRRRLKVERALRFRLARALKRIARIVPRPGYDLSWIEAKDARRIAQRSLGLPEED